MSNSTTIVLLTGANSGVGYATAKVFAAASAQYQIIMAGRSQQKIQKAAAEIESHGIKGSLSTLVLDVTNEESIAAAATDVRQRHGRIDVLINNAGVASQNPHRKSQLEETFAANTFGPVLMVEAFKELLLQSSNPRILNVTSGLGSLSMASDRSSGSYDVPYSVYRMSKAALNMYVIQIAKELDKRVKVFGVCPGHVRSNLRGTSEEQVSAGGKAVDAEISGVLMLNVVEGRRDADMGRIVKEGGTWEW